MTDEELAAYRSKPRSEPRVGLGDVVAAATTAVGIKPCEPCERRKETLNALTPPVAARTLGVLGRLIERFRK
jgi:hypothetical protein